MTLSFITDRDGLGPGSGHIGEVKCLTIITGGQAPIVSDQIYFSKPWLLLIPFRKGTNRNLMFHERPRFRARLTSQLMLASLNPQQPIDRGGTDLQQLLSGQAIATQLVVALQDRHPLRSSWFQTLAANVIHPSPDLD